MYINLLLRIFLFMLGFLLVKYRHSIALSFMKQREWFGIKRGWFGIKPEHIKKLDEIMLLVVGCIFMMLSFLP